MVFPPKVPFSVSLGVCRMGPFPRIFLSNSLGSFRAPPPFGVTPLSPASRPRALLFRVSCLLFFEIVGAHVAPSLLRDVKDFSSAGCPIPDQRSMPTDVSRKFSCLPRMVFVNVLSLTPHPEILCLCSFFFFFTFFLVRFSVFFPSKFREFQYWHPP